MSPCASALEYNRVKHERYHTLAMKKLHFYNTRLVRNFVVDSTQRAAQAAWDSIRGGQERSDAGLVSEYPSQSLQANPPG